MFYDLYCELCKKKDVTPTRAALEIGLSKSTPTAWKKQGITPQAAQLQKIADYFGVSVDYLCGKKETPAESGERTLTFDDFTYAMHEASKNLSERDKQILLGMAEQLKKSKGKE